MNTNDEQIRCPKCRSSQIHVHKRGFKTGRAAAGILVTGRVDVAAIAGAAGMNKIRLTCLNCGNEFNPGESIKIQNKSNQEEIKDFEKHVISKDEQEKIVLYKCDCGKESSLPESRPICPKCGRRQYSRNIFKPEYKKNKGCFGLILIAAVTLIAILL